MDSFPELEAHTYDYHREPLIEETLIEHMTRMTNNKLERLGVTLGKFHFNLQIF
jgi:hypothetical protein